MPLPRAVKGHPILPVLASLVGIAVFLLREKAIAGSWGRLSASAPATSRRRCTTAGFERRCIIALHTCASVSFSRRVPR
jgi:hypothetical protein